MGSPAPAHAQASEHAGRAIVIPRVERPPALEDFLPLGDASDVARHLVKVDRFIQREPRDGEISTERTEVFLGYDSDNLYAVFVCFDRDPASIRARMASRENIDGDEWVHIVLDTFQDRRRAYAFSSNPLGVQWDALWTEDRGMDASFDTLYHTRGRLTDEGYVVWMAIPFKSLRFPRAPEQTWGLALGRNIPRLNEQAFWPQYSTRFEGRLNQAGSATGLERISPSRNVQVIPYGMSRAFRVLDATNPSGARLVRDLADTNLGLDAKFVVKDRLVVDVAANPDFSQVESDEPQLTVNQRFEVFYPEKRPFFLENASYFQTPINLVFTRRIADPELGVRLTAKVGPYAVAALAADDESPGKRVASSSPLFGTRASFGVVRVSRDVLGQSTVGLIYTQRAHEGARNRVGGVDGRFKLGRNWVARGQAVASETTRGDGSRLSGPAVTAEVIRSGRQLNYSLGYVDRSPGFLAQAGFVTRTDVRQITQSARYRFRPEGRRLIAWGPDVTLLRLWDHTGLRLDTSYVPSLNWEFKRQTSLGVGYSTGRERLRPRDARGLAAPADFGVNLKSVSLRTGYFSQLTVTATAAWGRTINLAPPLGSPPESADAALAHLTVTFQPARRLRVDTTYLRSRLADPASKAVIFDDHTLRSRWNWQFTRELSVRAIAQYRATLPNGVLSGLTRTKSLNGDVLVTYRVNPWTVLFVGYNGNARNVELVETPAGPSLVRGRGPIAHDASQFFVKYSHLVRF